MKIKIQILQNIDNKLIKNLQKNKNKVKNFLTLNKVNASQQ